MPVIKYFVLLVLIISILQASILSVGFLLRKATNRKASVFFGLLLLAFTFSSIDIVLLRSASLAPHFQHLYHAPLWMSLFFGPLLFYHVKFMLFPNYRLRFSDSKHFVLGGIQWSFLMYMWIQPLSIQNQIWHNFIRPYYGPMEYGTFLLTLFLYLIITYRYIRYKDALLRRRGDVAGVEVTNMLRWMVKVFVVLMSIYSFFALTDFVAFNFYNINLFDVATFAYAGDLFFAGMLLWLSYHGLKQLSPCFHLGKYWG